MIGLFGGSTEAQEVLNVILHEIEDDIAGESAIDDNRLFQVACYHGTSFLVGGAAALIHNVGQERFDQCATQREEDMKAAVTFLLMAIVIDRIVDGNAESDCGGGVPVQSYDGTAIFERAMSEAGLKFPSIRD
jgi:hypothetical protein